MGVFRIVLGAMRGAGTIGAVAVERLAVEPTRPPARAARVASASEPRDTGLDAFFPSQSENAALLDPYLIRSAERS